MLKQSDALDLAMSIWSGPRVSEGERLEAIDLAMRSSAVSSASVPDGAPRQIRELAEKSKTNYLPLLVRVFRQALRVDGYLTSVPDERSPWRWWQANRLDARQAGIHDSALKYGAAYLRILPGELNGVPAPVVRAFTPRYLTAVYADPECDLWPLATLHSEGSHLVLTDEVAEYRFGIEDRRTLAQRTISPSSATFIGPMGMSFIESRRHDSGVCPVVRYRDMMALDGEEQFGIVEPLMRVQQRIDQVGFDTMIAEFFAIFRQRYVLGWVPKDEAEEVKASAARIFYNPDPDVKVGEWQATDIDPYDKLAASARKDFAALGQIPAGDLGLDSISNISDATLAGLEASKNRRANEMASALGESHEQSLRLMAFMSGDDEAAGDFSSEVRWASREARSWAGTIDGLVKLVQAQILSQDAAVAMLPDLSDQQVADIRADNRRQAGRGVLSALRERAATPPVAPPDMPAMSSVDVPG